jgi:hypothetical protein
MPKYVTEDVGRLTKSMRDLFEVDMEANLREEMWQTTAPRKIS